MLSLSWRGPCAALHACGLRWMRTTFAVHSQVRRKPHPHNCVKPGASSSRCSASPPSQHSRRRDDARPPWQQFATAVREEEPRRCRGCIQARERQPAAPCARGRRLLWTAPHSHGSREPPPDVRRRLWARLGMEGEPRRESRIRPFVLKNSARPPLGAFQGSLTSWPLVVRGFYTASPVARWCQRVCLVRTRRWTTARAPVACRGGPARAAWRDVPAVGAARH